MDVGFDGMIAGSCPRRWLMAKLQKCHEFHDPREPARKADEPEPDRPIIKYQIVFSGLRVWLHVAVCIFRNVGSKIDYF